MFLNEKEREIEIGLARLYNGIREMNYISSKMNYLLGKEKGWELERLKNSRKSLTLAMNNMGCGVYGYIKFITDLKEMDLPSVNSMIIDDWGYESISTMIDKTSTNKFCGDMRRFKIEFTKIVLSIVENIGKIKKVIKNRYEVCTYLDDVVDYIIEARKELSKKQPKQI